MNIYSQKDHIQLPIYNSAYNYLQVVLYGLYNICASCQEGFAATNDHYANWKRDYGSIRERQVKLSPQCILPVNLQFENTW